MQTSLLGLVRIDVFQLYFDFSGYSDMAIGLGYMFGFKYRKTLLSYISKSMSEFWAMAPLGSFFQGLCISRWAGTEGIN